MYCSIEEAWGPQVPEEDSQMRRKPRRQLKKETTTVSALTTSSSVPQLLQPPSSSYFSPEQETVNRNYSRDISPMEQRFTAKSRVPNIQPLEIDGDSVSSYVQFEDTTAPVKESFSDEETIVSTATLKTISQKVDELMARIDEIQKHRDISQRSDFLTTAANTILGIFFGIMVILLLDVSFRYGKLSMVGK